jgi:hypothetical protein
LILTIYSPRTPRMKLIMTVKAIIVLEDWVCCESDNENTETVDMKTTDLKTIGIKTTEL